MNGYRLSVSGLTERPYFVRLTGIHFYSVEELCFYLFRYPALIDEEIMNEKLVRWLAEEFGLREIAYRMEKALASGKAADFLMPLMRDTGYLDAGGLRIFTRNLMMLGQADAMERLRLRGDALVRNHRYGAACEYYDHALDESGKSGGRQMAVILSRKAAAEMQLLSLEEALRDYRKAFEISGTREDLRSYLKALKLAKPDAQYRAAAEELLVEEELVRSVDEEVEAAAAEPVEMPENEEQALARLCRLYRNEAEV